MSPKLNTELKGITPASIQPTVQTTPSPYYPPAIQDSTATGLERLANVLIPLTGRAIGAAYKSSVKRGTILAERNAALTTKEILEKEDVAWGLNDWVSIGINQRKGANMGRSFMQEWETTALPGMVHEHSTIEDIMSAADAALTDYTKTFNISGEGEDGESRLLERNREAMADAAFEEYGKMRGRLGARSAQYIQGARDAAFDVEAGLVVRDVLLNNGGEDEINDLLNSDQPDSLSAQAENWGIPKYKIKKAVIGSVINILDSEEVDQSTLFRLSGIAVDIGMGRDISWLAEDTEDAARFMASYRSAESRDLTRLGVEARNAEAGRKERKRLWYTDVPDIVSTGAQAEVNEHITLGMMLKVENPGGKIKQYRDSTESKLTPAQHAELRFSMLSHGGFNADLAKDLSYSDQIKMFDYEGERAALIGQVSRNPVFKHHLAQFADAIGGQLITTQDGGVVFVSSTVRDEYTERAKRLLFYRVVRESMTHVSSPRTAAGVDIGAAREFSKGLDKVFTLNETAYKKFLEADSVRDRKLLIDGFLHNDSGAQAPPNVGQ